MKAEEYTKDGPLFLSVHNLNYGEEVDFRESNHISMERYDESPEIMLQEDDILLAKDGAGIGKIGIVKNLSQLTTVNSSLLVIRSREAFVPKYLFYFLSGPQLQSIVQQRITGSATPHLFQKDIKQFILSMPPLLEQHAIANRIEELFHFASDVEERVANATAHTDRLTQSILAKAFRGELVPQDPDDEPASVLLERIGNERGL
ncbi:MAG: EcoKI restriction-modification system protein HsdS [Candidatus Syntrophoarchaeum sp. GoM_oil]|nr:MAG: EcoKI restriction-modification system protein HsdS [Candidatus Syntrophoarchaeum sp. GoM_oil]